MGRAPSTKPFAGLKALLAEYETPAAGRFTLRQLQEEWGFVNDNLEPAELAVRLFDHAARRFPGRAMAYTQLAMLMFNLCQEPQQDDPHVAAAKRHLRRADRLLDRRYGRRLLRLGKCARASIDPEDWNSVAEPRARKRLEGAVRSFIQTCKQIKPDNLDPTLRREYFVNLREVPPDAVSDPEDRQWLQAMLKRAAGRRPN